MRECFPFKTGDLEGRGAGGGAAAPTAKSSFDLDKSLTHVSDVKAPYALNTNCDHRFAKYKADHEHIIRVSHSMSQQCHFQAIAGSRLPQRNAIK